MLSESHPSQRLLTFTDSHGALLAEFDYYPTQELLHVRWHGHLTAAAVIEGVRAGIALRQSGAAPRRLLDDKSGATGEWQDALPWVQYEWLPGAVAGGLIAVAYVRSPDTATQLTSLNFVNALRQLLPVGIFPDATAARHWLLTHG
jgi:hypothetical protein